MIGSFAPIAGPDARVLVLGTIPSSRSLAEGQYYAHPRNAFWPIMQDLFAGGARLDYSSRVEMLVRARVAVWDVLRFAERDGSLDSAIVPASETPNDIVGFPVAHPDIGSIFFNGAKAEALFERRVAASVPRDRPLAFRRLPSTSPANAGVPATAKSEAWQAVAVAVGGPPETTPEAQRAR